MLDFFFKPQAIAVIGASREPGKVGHDVLKNLLDYKFPGPVYPVNPKAQEILGLKAYPSINELPQGVDLAVVAVRAPLVPEVISLCGQKGIKGAVVLSSGFKETGREGAKLELELIESARKHKVRIIGPNCLGILDTYSRLNATFAALKPLKGKIGFFSQSGALCLAVLEWSRAEKIGLSRFVSLGNKADISEIECLRALAEDPHTEIIMGYLEGIEDGRAFTEVASQVSRQKPVIIFKSGITAAGARAASSHTGSLAGSQEAFLAAVKRAGIIRAETLREFFNLALYFAGNPPMEGPYLGILTNSGGPGIIAADACEKSSLELPTLSAETIEKLRQVLPPYASFYNPVDITGDADAERYKKALSLLLEDKTLNGLLVILSRTATVDPEAVAETLSDKKGTKPLVACFIGEESVKKAKTKLLKAHIPHFEYPEEAVSVFDKSWRYKFWLNKPRPKAKRLKVDFKRAAEVLQLVRSEGRRYFLDHEVKQILEAYGFTFPKTLLARTTDEALLAAKVIGYPVVLKLVSPQVQHKTDIGGVKLNIQNDEELVKAFQEMLISVRKRLPGVSVLGVIVQEMVYKGKEVIVGFLRDPQFGPIVMFGLGGIYVEVMKDVTFNLAPLSKEEALEMIREIKAYPVLKGIRGEPEVDMNALARSIMAMGQLVSDFPELSEGEINPLIIGPRGFKTIAVDARLSLGGEK
ncbi:acetate--CoA ligase alpha subunit [Thermodesulfatator autotrophicus]|uniref:Acyl-CoA synthetase n=1 Tax=Thermodesulfatator autotrophicus TaxID=1795632 RepID=A0A177EBQ9_9BACT|nr:acetate--CoA ligase family protein [Thermodesulfatator autotrophicus]OAG28439.1 acyl-CoA synthetase [Thermodesulfatator autotrophicus]